MSQSSEPKAPVLGPGGGKSSCLSPTSMDCIEDNVTTAIILLNLCCGPTTPHAALFGPFRAGRVKKELNLNRSDS